MTLLAKQRKYLKALAHHLEPVVRIGRARLTDALVGEVARSLEAHELIKIRLDVDAPGARRELAASLANQTGADLVTTVGKMAILYRARQEKPKIKLP